MNELHYQLDLLKAMNQKLAEKERMYAKVCESAEGAFLYCSFEKNMIYALGQWNDFFDFEIRESKDFSRLLDAVEEQYVLALRDVLFLEKLEEKYKSVCIGCNSIFTAIPVLEQVCIYNWFKYIAKWFIHKLKCKR